MNSLEIRNLRVEYRVGTGALAALGGVSLAVPHGRTLGLVGESGSGKSTLARAVVGLAPVAAGSILLNGKPVSLGRSRRSREFRRRVQMVFQDPYSSLNPRLSVGDMLLDAVQAQGLRTGSERRRAVEEVLELVGIPKSAWSRYAHEFSGGQRQRLGIARALAVKPDIIITDEVTSALDVSVQATILNLLLDLQRSLGLSYLFISHDLAVVRYVSNEVALMYLGQIVELAAVDDLFAASRHPYTRMLLSSIPTLVRRGGPVNASGEVPDPRNPPVGCPFHPRCPSGPRFNLHREQCMRSKPDLAPNTGSHQVACHYWQQIQMEFNPAGSQDLRVKP
jgi:peptide/nickel transport system ATP-binding protein